LAALGIAFSLAVAVESPVVALLTAAVALADNRDSFLLLRRFTLALIFFVTSVMLLLGLTPLFDVVVLRLIGAPVQVAARVRPVLWALTLFPAAVAVRRFQQGIMIRFGYTRQVGYGTAIRLLTIVGVSIGGWMWCKLDGATLGGLALGIALVVEATYIHLASRSAVRQVNVIEPQVDNLPLTVRVLLRFYWPLAFTSLAWLWAPSLISFGLARASHPVESLATWPVVSSQVSMVSSFGLSFQDVIVARLDNVRSMKILYRFALMLGVGSLVFLTVVSFTSVAPWWQQEIAGLDGELAPFAISALRFAVLLPVLAVVLSWLRAIIVTGKATQSIARATFFNFVVLVGVLLAGTKGSGLPGASIAAIALTASRLTESAWLWRSARTVLRQLSG
jgi:hypothetical protein